MEKVPAIVARSTFPSQSVRGAPCSGHVWGLRCRKRRAVLARSGFPSQNVKSRSCSDHFWKLRCGKSAFRCGAKQISKSTVNMLKTHFGPLLDVQMSLCVAGTRIVHLVTSEQHVRLLWHFQKRWRACDI